MRKERVTLWRLIIILFVLCVASTASAQQNSTESKELQYTVKVDLQELVDTMKELTRNVSALTDNQKELTDNIKELTTNVNKINEKMSVIEERTKWMKDLLFLLLGGVILTIATPIILHFLANKNKINMKTPELNQLDAIEAGSVDETEYKYQTEGVTP